MRFEGTGVGPFEGRQAVVEAYRISRPTAPSSYWTWSTASGRRPEIQYWSD